MSDFLFLDESKTASLINMKEAVATCEAVLREQGEGLAVLSDPSAMFLDGDKAAPVKFKVKGGALTGLDVCGFRVVGDIGQDGILGEHHYCLLLDPVTAKPRALVAQTELHRIRTAACGLAALRQLISPKARTVALIGAGKIGAWFARGFHEVFPQLELIVASRRLESAQALTASIPNQKILALPVEDAVAAADAFVAISTATEPVLTGNAFKPGMTIIGMGEYHELPAALLHRADRFIVDDIGFASMLGSLSHWIARGDVTREAASARVSATLSAIVAGRATGRQSEEEIIVAIVQGLAIADLALADLCRRKMVG